MMTINKIPKGKLPELVKLSYAGDNELFEKFHPAKSDEQGSIENTLQMVEDIDRLYRCTYYQINWNKNAIGYFIIFKGFLYSFCINIKYRRKEVLVSWWDKVKSVLGKAFTTMLYTENFRAIAFVMKQGMKIRSVNENIVTLINKK